MTYDQNQVASMSSAALQGAPSLPPRFNAQALARLLDVPLPKARRVARLVFKEGLSPQDALRQIDTANANRAAKATQRRDTQAAQSLARGTSAFELKPQSGFFAPAGRVGLVWAQTLKQVATNPDAPVTLPPPSAKPATAASLEAIRARRDVSVGNFEVGGRLNWTALAYFLNDKRMEHMEDLMARQQEVSQNLLGAEVLSQMTEAELVKGGVLFERLETTMSDSVSFTQFMQNRESEAMKRLVKFDNVVPVGLLDVMHAGQVHPHCGPLQDMLREDSIRKLCGQTADKRPVIPVDWTVNEGNHKYFLDAPGKLGMDDAFQRDEAKIRQLGDAYREAGQNPEGRRTRILSEVVPGGEALRRRFLTDSEIAALPAERRDQYLRQMNDFWGYRINDIPGKLGDVMEERGRLRGAAARANAKADAVEAGHELPLGGLSKDEYVERCREHASLALSRAQELDRPIAALQTDFTHMMRIVGVGRRGMAELTRQMGYIASGVDELRKQRNELVIKFNRTNDPKEAAGLEATRRWNQETEDDLLRRCHILAQGIAAYSKPGNASVHNKLDVLEDMRDAFVAKPVAGGATAARARTNAVNEIDQKLAGKKKEQDDRTDLQELQRSGRLSRFNTGIAQKKFDEIMDDAALSPERKERRRAQFEAASPRFQYQLCELSYAYRNAARNEQGQRDAHGELPLQPGAVPALADKLAASSVIEPKAMEEHIDKRIKIVAERHGQGLLQRQVSQRGAYKELPEVKALEAERDFWRQQFAARDIRRVKPKQPLFGQPAAVMKPVSLSLPSRVRQDASAAPSETAKPGMLKDEDYLDEGKVREHLEDMFVGARAAQTGFVDTGYNRSIILNRLGQNAPYLKDIQAETEGAPHQAAVDTAQLAESLLQECDGMLRQALGDIQQMYNTALDPLLKPQNF